MNLIKAEVSRLTARRFIQAMAVMVLAFFALTLATTVASSHQPTAQEYSVAQQKADAARANNAAAKQNCLADHDPVDCAGYETQVQPESYLPNFFNYEKQMPGLLNFLAIYLCFFGFLVASSFIGAEMRSGGVTNLLLWKPNRTSVLGAKLTVALGGTALAGVAFTALYFGAFWVVAQAVGWLGTPDWLSLLALSARGIGLSLIVAAFGFALATIGRHTSAGLGALFGYIVFWELGGHIMTEVMGIFPNDYYFLSTYLSAWMEGRIQVGGTATMDDQFITAVFIQWWHAGILLTAVTGLLTLAAFATFRRRDLA